MTSLKEKEIIKNWNYNDRMYPRVSIRCITYNHSRYICEAFDSFLSQKTNFPFEIVVHDDCSTDGTTEIVKDYAAHFPNIIKPMFEEKNLWSQKISFSKKINAVCRGKYIALCEGDDYWCDDRKLQKQFDFMESHPEYSICLANSYKLDDITREKIPMDVFNGNNEISLQEQIEAGLTKDFPATATYFYRKTLLDEMPSSFYGHIVGDYPTRLWFASQGKSYCFSEPMAVYRVNNSNSHLGMLQRSTKKYYAHQRGMIKLWKMLDGYFDNKFHDMFASKIDDAIWGMCLSYSDEYSSKEELNEVCGGKNRKISELIDEDYVSPEILELSERCHGLYVFGQSMLAKRCRMQLEAKKLEFKGFVISDGYAKDNEILRGGGYRCIVLRSWKKMLA